MGAIMFDDDANIGRTPDTHMYFSSSPLPRPNLSSFFSTVNNTAQGGVLGYLLTAIPKSCAHTR